MTHLFKDVEEKKDEGVGLQKKRRSFFIIPYNAMGTLDLHVTGADLDNRKLSIDNCKATTTPQIKDFIGQMLKNKCAALAARTS